MNQFKEQLEKDLDNIFFNVNEFAIEVQLFGKEDHEGKKVLAIFEYDYRVVNFEEEVQIIVPTLLLKQKDLHEYKKNNYLRNVRIEDKIYGVTEIQPRVDGTTLVVLGDMLK
jgi:hypothetical protein